MYVFTYLQNDSHGQIEVSARDYATLHLPCSSFSLLALALSAVRLLLCVRYVMLCYVMLCYDMLCYVMLCYVMLYYVMLCYIMLCVVMI